MNLMNIPDTYSYVTRNAINNVNSIQSKIFHYFSTIQNMLYTIKTYLNSEQMRKHKTKQEKHKQTLYIYPVCTHFAQQFVCKILKYIFKFV